MAPQVVALKSSWKAPCVVCNGRLFPSWDDVKVAPDVPSQPLPGC